MWCNFQWTFIQNRFRGYNRHFHSQGWKFADTFFIITTLHIVFHLGMYVSNFGRPKFLVAQYSPELNTPYVIWNAFLWFCIPRCLQSSCTFDKIRCYKANTQTASSCIYLLTPWCRTLFEKLIITQLIKQYPAFFMENRRFFTVITKARHRSLSWARCIRSIPSNSISVTSIVILTCHLCLGLPSGSSLHVFQQKHCLHFSSLPCVLHVLHIPSYLIWSP